MQKVGENDAFERQYMGRFRAYAAQFGEVVLYERDRGARDIGLHLTRRLRAGGEALTGALCWFQMKGLMANTLSAEEFRRAGAVKLPLEVRHLRYWLLQPVPTYLAVYIQSVDTFLVLNITQYVEDRWGTDILTLDQVWATVTIPAQSVLDEQAFDILLRQSDVNQWAKALRADDESTGIIRADYNLIWHLGSATDRAVEHRVVFWDWQSKTRSQFWFQERTTTPVGEWEDIREHWQFMMSVSTLEDAYPYVEFYRLPDGDSPDPAPPDGFLVMGTPPPLSLRNGDVVYGENYLDEYFLYRMGARLNELGAELYASVTFLEKIKLLEIGLGEKETLSVAPWHTRAV